MSRFQYFQNTDILKEMLTFPKCFVTFIVAAIFHKIHPETSWFLGDN